MKKALALVLIFALSLGAMSVFTACGKDNAGEPPVVDPNPEPEPEPEPRIPEDDPELPGAFLVMIDNMEEMCIRDSCRRPDHARAGAR